MTTSRSESVLVNGRPLLVEAHVDGPTSAPGLDAAPRVRASAGESSVEGRLQAHGARLVLHPGDGRPLNAALAPTAHGAWVWVDGKARRVLDAESPEARRRTQGPGRAAQGLVTPPMPAVVTQVLVTTGDAVAQGDRLAVVSAMKMEMSLVAPHDGVITGVHVQTGDKVSPGDVLVDVAPAEPTEGAAPGDAPPASPKVSEASSTPEDGASS